MAAAAATFSDSADDPTVAPDPVDWNQSGPQSGHNITSFVTAHHLELATERALRALPAKEARLVMTKALRDVRNPDAVVMGRIKDLLIAKERGNPMPETLKPARWETPRGGDWECSACDNVNWANRSYCNRCKQPRSVCQVEQRPAADAAAGVASGSAAAPAGPPVAAAATAAASPAPGGPPAVRAAACGAAAAAVAEEQRAHSEAQLDRVRRREQEREQTRKRRALGQRCKTCKRFACIC
eukprot:TRINITY_DN30316_c0_g1_i1.p1 TRINITY_DN30316_c0_g1~~TRINITY_DN30316_c0_g1_i1.p1  ORF type:complete len:241 (+),score=51.52 TRINITY_DN30316_c0_g1_i1:96-818(+)